MRKWASLGLAIAVTAMATTQVAAQQASPAWNGFYAGLNAGGMFGNTSASFAGPAGPGGFSGAGSGFVGGAQAGYNYQIGSFVVGLEGDIQYADFGGDDRFDFDGDGILDDDFNTSDWFGTVRARAGVAFDRALIYATGGFAFADNATGWTVGGGLEYAFTNNLSAKIEGLYVNLDQDDNFPGLDLDNDAEFGVVRAGLNFRFGTY